MVAKAVVTTLERMLAALSDSQTPSAVIGGFAVAIWGHPRSTRDIDLLVDVSREERGNLIRRLAAHGFKPKRASAIVQVEGGELIQVQFAPPDAFLEIQADLFLAETEFQRAAISRRVEMPAPSLSGHVSVVTCEDLIFLKLLAGRVIDRVDAATLLKFNRDTLDMAYVASWIEKLNLQAEWDAIEREARG
jgi:hypothetical protein